MTWFRVYCPTCDNQVLIKPPLLGVRRRRVWTANCEHAKDIYIAQLQQQINDVEAAEWDIRLPYD